MRALIAVLLLMSSGRCWSKDWSANVDVGELRKNAAQRKSIEPAVAQVLRAEALKNKFPLSDWELSSLLARDGSEKTAMQELRRRMRVLRELKPGQVPAGADLLQVVPPRDLMDVSLGAFVRKLHTLIQKHDWNGLIAESLPRYQMAQLDYIVAERRAERLSRGGTSNQKTEEDYEANFAAELLALHGKTNNLASQPDKPVTEADLNRIHGVIFTDISEETEISGKVILDDGSFLNILLRTTRENGRFFLTGIEG